MSDVEINFFFFLIIIVQKSIFCVFVFFFYLKLTLYYCEDLLISVKPIVNNKDIDEHCCVIVDFINHTLSNVSGAQC